MSAHVVILGCGRSGTSIFGELFDALPGYRYLSEPLLSEVHEPDDGRRLAVKVPRAAAADLAPAGDPVVLEELFSTMPTPVVVFWQVRHPLDAICSLRVGIGSGWAHHPRPPDWEAWLDRPLVERCAHHWAVINGAGYGHVAGRAVVNRFEEMIRSPATSAEQALAVVGVDPDEARGPIATWSHRVRDTDDDRFVEALTSRRHSRPDHSRRVGRWHEGLTDQEVASVVPIVAEAAGRFGYELPT